MPKRTWLRMAKYHKVKYKLIDFEFPLYELSFENLSSSDTQPNLNLANLLFNLRNNEIQIPMKTFFL